MSPHELAQILALERAFPGLRCKSVRNDDSDVSATLTGAGADLVRHGIVLQTMLDLPACGERTYGPTIRNQRKGGVTAAPFWASVKRLRDGRFRVNRSWLNEEAAQFRRKVGLPHPPVRMPSQSFLQPSEPVIPESTGGLEELQGGGLGPDWAERLCIDGDVSAGRLARALRSEGLRIRFDASGDRWVITEGRRYLH